MTPSRRPAHSDDRQRAERFATHAARLLTDNRCADATLLDVRAVSAVTDFILIATGSSERQMAATVDELKELARQEGHSVYGRDNTTASGWMVVDFVDVVIHMFSAEQRAYYDIESLWGDAVRVDWRAVTEPGQFARLRSKSG